MIEIILWTWILGYCAWIIVHRYRAAKLAARMGRIMGCAGCTGCSCGSCASAPERQKTVR